MEDFYNIKLKEVYKRLNSSDKGLSSGDAVKRLGKYGYNELKQEKKISSFKIFISQFKDPMLTPVLAVFLLKLLRR